MKEDMEKRKSPHIVVVDDRPREIAPMLAELEARSLIVSVISSAEELENLLNQDITLDLFVLDVMIYGVQEFFSENATQGGMVAGLLIGRMLREIGIGCPIVFYSQASFGNIINQIEDYSKILPNTAYVAKYDQHPAVFADTICEFLKTGKVEGTVKKFLTVIGDSLILQPTIFGLGVYLKKLAKNA